MNNLISTKDSEFIAFLKLNLEFVEAFFMYLPYKKISDLKYTLTYFYHDLFQFQGIPAIILELERCIKYQTSNKKELNIPAEIVFEQKVIINEKEIDFIYRGQLVVQATSALIFWNWYQSTPTVKLQLNEPIPPMKIMSLFENFQIAINDIKEKYE